MVSVPKVEEVSHYGMRVRVDGVEHHYSTSGATRYVFFVGDVVVKTAKHASQGANRREWESWQRVKDTPDARFFAEVLAYENGVLVQRRVRGCDDAPTQEQRQVIADLRVRWDFLQDVCPGLAGVCCGDSRPHNWRVAEDGTPTIYDMG